VAASDGRDQVSLAGVAVAAEPERREANARGL
jgi:hypothetical protein